MKAKVYTGPGWNWCERVKSLLTDNDYEVEEVQINSNVMEEFQNKFNLTMRTIPQVVINDKLIGGYGDVEKFLEEKGWS